MLQADLYLVVIAGGSGTRFWPKSTSQCPKQLLSFGAGPEGLPKPSLLAETLARFDGWVPEGQQIIVTTQLIQEAVETQGVSAEILAEPQGRNTAPAIYWAARHVAEQNPAGIMLVMPADHYIAYPDRFRAAAGNAANWARTHDDLVTLGVPPSRPETGYGYLQTGQQLGSGVESTRPRAVESFVEKPNLDKAVEYVKSKTYLWNAGMFLWKASAILAAFDQYMPEMKQAWTASGGDVEKAYPKMTATSIDYGVMEKAKNVVTFSLDCGWDDLGSWTSLGDLAKVLGYQRGENVLAGGELVALESSRNIVDVQGKLVALLGVKDLIVVEQGGALLVASKDRAQDIRKLVEAVKSVRPDLV